MMHSEMRKEKQVHEYENGVNETNKWHYQIQKCKNASLSQVQTVGV